MTYMKEKRLKKYSLLNLIIGYLTGGAFIILILLHLNAREEIKLADDSLAITNTIITESNQDKEEGGAYVSPPLIPQSTVIPIYSPREVLVDKALPIYHDRFIEKEINNERIFYTDRDTITVVDDNDRAVLTRDDGFHSVDRTLFSDGFTAKPRNVRNNYQNNEGIDFGLLDRRLAELDTIDAYGNRRAEYNRKNKEKVGLHTEERGVDFSRLSPSDGDDLELGELNSFTDSSLNPPKGYAVGKGGQLYAYNFPGRGLGAGVGSSAIGAGAGGGAGLGAGIGEGILNGEVVPTLGGVGDGAKSLDGEPAAPAGIGGLVGGAGAGGAAGLPQGYITEKVGLGIGEGSGGVGGHKNGREYNYTHLPRDGGLHIMMHVDGSGSILNTRKQLDIMKDTLLKDALLPYYNNNANLYNQRVTIVDGSGERTLRFFNQAAEKKNVLAVVFQDEAQPAYHLPNFNKSPESNYLDDLNKLKSNLNKHKGLYRGIMFQVDRGRPSQSLLKSSSETLFRERATYLRTI